MEQIKLSDLFDNAYKLFESFDKRDDASNSPEYQVSARYRNAASFFQIGNFFCFESFIN